MVLQRTAMMLETAGVQRKESGTGPLGWRRRPTGCSGPSPSGAKIGDAAVLKDAQRSADAIGPVGI